MKNQEAFHMNTVSRLLGCLFLAGTMAVLLDIGIALAGNSCPVWLFVLCIATVATLAFFCRLTTAELWKVWAVILLLCVLVIVAVALIWYSFYASAVYSDADSGKQEVYGGRKVLVLAPHEDDEINNLGGVLEEFVKYGSDVQVVFVTNGEYKDYGLQRIDEGIASVVSCGIPEENVLFLGFGNDWQGGVHIYNAGPDELMTSKYGYTATYGAQSHPPVRSDVPYTRQNLADELKSVIMENRPDIIFCTDYDVHEDHKAVSLLFEEAMGQVLACTEDYHPEVYKGFAYVTAYYSVDDFYAENMLSSVNAGGEQYLRNYSNYRWDDRVRFPVCSSSLSRSLYNCRVYLQSRLHMSQPIRFLAKAVINGDKVFWYRPTDSISYHAQFTVSSGKPELLNDFRYLDTENVLSLDSPFSGTWVPGENDTEKTITVTWENPVSVEEVRLYDNPSLSENVLLAEVSVNGETPLEVSLEQDGSATVVPIQAEQARTITVRLADCEGAYAGITEVEVFETVPQPESSFIKICNGYGDFAYDYHMIADEETFQLYRYNCDENSRFTVECSNSYCSAQITDNGIITVRCPKGQNCILKVSTEDGTLSDSVVLSRSGWLCRAGQGIEDYLTRHYEALRDTVTYSVANRVFHLFVKEHYVL